MEGEMAPQVRPPSSLSPMPATSRPVVPAPAVQTLIDGIDASPTPYHAVAEIARRLTDAGFESADLTKPFPSEPGLRFVRRGGALVGWIQPDGPIEGFTVVGAHSDSPNLRVRHDAQVSSAGWAQLGIEVYGGVLLNSWLDRDLGLAGRVRVRTGNSEGPDANADGTEERLVIDRSPVLRVPQLAIHLDREIRETGLLLNPQTHMTPLWATGEDEPGAYTAYLAELAGTAPDTIMAAEIMAFDTQPAALVGREGDLIASSRIDNQFSCFAGVEALLAVAVDSGIASASPLRRVPVFVMFDHEEIGSTTANGAAGRFLASILERISLSGPSSGTGANSDRSQFLAQLSQSLVISADGAHATHPNYADKHEPNHHIAVNAGVVVKRNANQRYATDADSEWFIRSVCADAGLPLQTYHHRNDLPCGSTIGPATAAALGVATLDIGAPQLAMHSIRELAGAADVGHLIDTLTAAWRSSLPISGG